MMGKRAFYLLPALALLVHLYVLNAIVQRAEWHAAGNRRPSGDHGVLALFNDVTHRIGPAADFFALYHAGVEAKTGNDIYGWRKDGKTPYYYSFRYLPWFAHSAGRLFQKLPPWTAYYLWLGLLEAAILGCLLLTYRLLRGSPLVPWIFTLWLLCTPLWLELFMGQFTLVMTALVLWTGVLMQEGKYGRSLLSWGTSVAVKIYSLVLLPAYWNVSRRLAVKAGLLGAAIGALNLAFFFPQMKRFVQLNFGGDVALVGLDTGNFGLTYLLHLLLVPGLGIDVEVWPKIYRVLHPLLLGGTALVVVLKRRSEPLLTVPLLLLAHQISYIHVWEHHYVLSFGAGVMVLAATVRSRMRWLVLGSLVLIAAPTPFWLWDLPGGDPGGKWTLLQRMVLPACKALPTLVIYAVGMRALFGSASKSAQPSHDEANATPLVTGFDGNDARRAEA